MPVLLSVAPFTLSQCPSFHNQWCDQPFCEGGWTLENEVYFKGWRFRKKQFKDRREHKNQRQKQGENGWQIKYAGNLQSWLSLFLPLPLPWADPATCLDQQIKMHWKQCGGASTCRYHVVQRTVNMAQDAEFSVRIYCTYVRPLNPEVVCYTAINSWNIEKNMRFKLGRVRLMRGAQCCPGPASVLGMPQIPVLQEWVFFVILPFIQW